MWEHLLVVPIMLPLGGAVLAAFAGARSGAWIALLISALSLLVSGLVLAATLTGGVQTYRVGGLPPPYGIVLVADRFSAALAATTAAVATAGALHTLVAREGVLRRRLYHPLFLLLLAALGGVFLTGDVFNLYVFMEMVVLASFTLVAMANRPVSAEVTFKLALLSAIGSLLLLLSAALVYAATGTLNMADVARRADQAADAPFWPVAGAMMLSAFLLKGAIFPFHFWQPDAHSAAPSPVSAMLSGILVKVGFYGIVRMAVLLFPDTPALLALTPLGAASALFGALAALASRDLKRLLAYSTIANMGLILLALGWGGQLGLTAAIVNAINHALIKASLFLAGGYVAERLQEYDLGKLGGLARLSPATTLAIGLGSLGLAGLPPLSGFASKVTLFQSGLDAGDAASLVVAALASGLGIAYSLRFFTLLCWGEPGDTALERWKEGEGRIGGPAAPLALALGYVTLGLWPGPLVDLAAAAAADLRRPDLYLTAVLGGAS